MVGVQTVVEALQLINRKEFDVLLADLNIGEPGDGFTVVSAMRRVQPHASTFILTGYPDIETAIMAIRSQVDDYFTKPLDIQRLLDAISSKGRGERSASKFRAPTKVVDLIHQKNRTICDRWLHEVMRDPDLTSIPMSSSSASIICHGCRRNWVYK